MKKIYTLLGAAAVCASAAAGTTLPSGRIDLSGMLNTVAVERQHMAVTSTSNVEVRPLCAPSPRKASVENKSVLLYEDFNNVPDGDTETTGNIGERYTDFIASHYFQPGRYIDNSYTPESGTWEGDWIFAGKGGTVILQPYNSQMPARLNTPLGDYSGDITVTVRARFSKTFWGADTESGYATTNGSNLVIAACIHGYDATEITDRATTDMSYGQLTSNVVYEADGWQEFTFKFQNQSANKDGYLCFNTSTALEIDWIKITDDNTFLACPVINPVTNFTNDGFTINWDPVRRAGNYYIDLYKTVYTADKGVDEYFDFEEKSMPEWIASASGEFIEGEGKNGSTGYLLAGDGEENALTTTDSGMKLKTFSTEVKFQMDDPENYLFLYCDAYSEETGWIPFGAIACDNFMVFPGYYYTLQLSGEMFEDQFTAVRLYPFGSSEDNKVYLDELQAFAPRPYVLERVYNENFSMEYSSTDDDAPYNFYTYTDRDSDPQHPGRTANYYTFVGLDPETEYWYRVRSHNVSDFTIGEKYHAFGVAAPEALLATNISSSSYTANWRDVAKAQKYIVTNYTGTKTENDDPDYTLMLETMSRCNGETEINFMEPIGNISESFLDDYTDLRGWSGVNNYYGQNMIGGLDYTGSYLITPPIMCNPARGSLYVYIEGLGYYGDYMHITCLKSGMSADIEFDEEGQCSGWIEIPAVEGEQIRLNSMYGYCFAISAFEASQAVKAGDIIRKFYNSTEVAAGEQSYTFSNLENDIYSYNVVASFTLDGETVLSNSSIFVTVDLASEKSDVTNKIDAIGVEPTEMERYNVNGIRVNNDYKGVVIVKMNDGSVSKKVVK